MSARHALIAATVFVAGLSPAAQAAGDPALGKELATTCMGCHAIPGYRNAYPSYRVPMLGGQNPDYLVIALQEYRARTRPHPTMQAQAASLSDEDMQNLAAFFASQGQPQTGATVSTGIAAAGKEKAAVCAACHGEAGVSKAPNWPNLAGQHRDYLEQAISRYRDKQRADPVMQSQAVTLTDEEVKNLAAYFSAQSGVFTVRYQ